MTIDEMVKRHGSWLEAGVDEGPVVSSRIRLARNVQEFSFPSWANEEEMLEVWTQVLTIFETEEPSFAHWNMGETPVLDKEILFERHLVSQELALKEEDCGVFVSPDECMSIMVNEEDHIRIQSLQPGLNLSKAWDAADRMDDVLERGLSYAFSAKLGYLTSCPSNVGTGLRASVMLHLPGLVLLEEMEPVINGISRIGLAVRGLWGEGTEAAGNMFQVSNQITLGRREDEIISHLEQIVLELVEHENNARIRLMNDRAMMVEDHVARALGILSHARMVSSSEALNLLSALRLGLDLGLVEKLSRRELDMLFIATQPAHLQKIKQQHLVPDERDVARANMLRTFVKKIDPESSGEK
jgi:protein arginine kinase